jgi:two-component sensor histidine kinase
MASSSDNTAGTAFAAKFARTTLFCLAIGLTIWALGWSSPWWAATLVSLSIGYSITVTAHLLDPFLSRWMPSGWTIVPIALIGVFIGILVGGLVTTGRPLYFLYDEDLSAPILAIFFGVLGLLFFTGQRRLQKARAELAVTRAARLAEEKARLETELKLLQAQIEPHFLFNTLSNVVGMIRDQPDAAEAMLLKLTTLLRHSLNRTREETIRLGDELTLVEALLGINQIRMGERLTWKIDVAPELRDARLPPLLLQPLVENAITHGIEPDEQGGTIDISARREGLNLTISVRDSGVGLSGSGGAGVGIANVTQRLAALYGESGKLMLTELEPRGTLAVITLPMDDP